MYFAIDAFTGHTYGWIGHSTRTGVFSSQPASSSVLRAYSGGCDSNVHAVSVPSSVGTPREFKSCCDSALRVIMSESWMYRPHMDSISASMWPASPPYPTDSLFSAEARPSDPIIIVVSAFANLLLNIDPSQAITP